MKIETNINACMLFDFQKSIEYVLMRRGQLLSSLLQKPCHTKHQNFIHALLSPIELVKILAIVQETVYCLVFKFCFYQRHINKKFYVDILFNAEAKSMPFNYCPIACTVELLILFATEKVLYD